MRTNPILEDTWRVKDELSKEAGGNIHKLCEQTRQWAQEHPHDGPVVRNADELRRLIAEKERQRAIESAHVLTEEAPEDPAP